MKIAISAETTIDLPKPMLEEFDISLIPFTVIMGEEEFADGEVTPAELFAYTEKTGKLPRTAAINQYQYGEYFRSLLKKYDVVIHFCLSGEMSTACNNAIAASREDDLEGKVYVVDSRVLSTGIALEAIYARRLANVGKSPEEIVELVKERIPYSNTSFSLESVNYLYKGGRCSMLAMMGANLLRLKPAIYVNDGKMGAGKKYRGPMLKAVMDYVEDTLALYPNPDHDLVFITYSSAPDNVVKAVEERLKKAGFRDIRKTTAGGTISCHCGPHCLGILYFNDGDHPLGD